MNTLIEGIIDDTVHKYRGEYVLNIVHKLLGRKLNIDWLDESLAADIFYLFYLPFPKLKYQEATIENTKYAILQALQREPALWKTKPLTVADRIISIVAAASFLEKIVKELSTSSRPKHGQDNTKDQIKNAVSKALVETINITKNASNIKQLIAKIGAGKASTLQYEDVLETILELAKNTDIANILHLLAGIEVAKLSTRHTTRATKGWITGMEIGGDLERIHYSRLAFPEILFLAELANSRLLLYRKELPAIQGSFYVLLDKSGSMSGTKIDWARAVALALFIKSKSSRRHFYARFFDSIVYDLVEAHYNSPTSRSIQVLKYLGTVKAGGGTDIIKALATASNDLLTFEKNTVSDVILITDGEDKLSKHILSSIISRGGFRLHTIMIQGDNPVLREVSDNYFTVEKLDKKDILRVVTF